MIGLKLPQAMRTMGVLRGSVACMEPDISDCIELMNQSIADLAEVLCRDTVVAVKAGLLHILLRLHL